MSRFDSNKGQNLKFFVESIVSRVNPVLVLVTGDLTDAKNAFIGSEQSEAEWIEYANSISTASGRPNFWLDVRGNHDCFDVESRTSPENYFATYSASKKHSYSYTHRTEYGNYTFVSVDICPEPGPERPYNFFGYYNQEQHEFLSRELSLAASHNHTFVMGHYPFSIWSVAPEVSLESFKSITENVSMYVCGHLHTLGGACKRMYRHFPGGGLELELADLKDNHGYRIVAVDHDMVSFVDSGLSSKLDLVVSNPKDARFYIPRKERIDLISISTHIRVLAFPPESVSSIVAFIDGHELDSKFRLADASAPLFVAPWSPASLSGGIHELMLKVTTKTGEIHFKKQPFSVDGTPASLVSTCSSLLETDFKRLIPKTFWSTHLLALFLFLVAPKVIHGLMERSGSYLAWRTAVMTRMGFVASGEVGWLQSLYACLGFIAMGYTELARHAGTFWFVFGYGIYVMFGPIVVAPLVPSSGRLDIVYLRYLSMGSTTLYSTDSYFHVMPFLCVFYYPFLVLMAGILAFHADASSKEKFARLYRFFFIFVVWFWYCAMLYTCHLLVRDTHVVSFFLAPAITWYAVIVGFVLAHHLRIFVFKWSFRLPFRSAPIDG